jgi:hypothetical protein
MDSPEGQKSIAVRDVLWNLLELLAAVRFHTFFGDGQAKGGLAICH